MRSIKAWDTRLGGLLVMALVNVICGANFPFVKPALETIPPFTFALLRFCTALAVLLPFAGRGTLAVLRSTDGMRVVTMGLTGMCLAQVAQTLALKLSTASDISLLSITSPLWIAILARLWLHERIGHRGALGFGLAAAGLALILWPRDGGDMGTRRIAGDAIYMLTGLGWAWCTVLGKIVLERHSPLPMIAAASLVGTLGILPFAAYELLSGQTPTFTLAGVGGVAYAGVLVTVVGFLGLFWGLARVQATQSAILMYLQPLAGVLISWVLLHERLSPAFIAGGVLVLIAIGFVARSASPTGAQPVSVDSSALQTNDNR